MQRTFKDIKEKNNRRLLKKLNKLRNEELKSERASRPTKPNGIKRTFQVSNQHKKEFLYKPLKEIISQISEPGYLTPPCRYFHGTDSQPIILDLDINEFKKLTPYQKLCFDREPGCLEELNMDWSESGPNRQKYNYPKRFKLSRRCRDMLYVKEEINWERSWGYPPQSSKEKELENYIKNHNIKKDEKKLLGWDYDWDYNKDKRSAKDNDLRKQVKRDVEEVW